VSAAAGAVPPAPPVRDLGKRVFETALTVASLPLVLPLAAACAVAIAVDTPGPIVFTQQRTGRDGRRFSMYKFRTMIRDAEALKPSLRHLSVLPPPDFKIPNDPRITRVGRFLRRTSLDELPQLINILRGDMSIVGPRPERPHFVDQFATLYPRYTARHRVPAGLTGWSQVHGLRGDTSIEERARFDNYYIENWTLWLDIRICLLTVGAVLREVMEHRAASKRATAAVSTPASTGVRLVEPLADLV